MKPPERLPLLLVCLLSSSAFAQTTTWDVLATGARPDGATDNTAIFQRLLDEAGKAGGGVVNVPAGSFRIAENLSIPANVIFGRQQEQTSALSARIMWARFDGRAHAI
jgi:hypothetical protein